MVKNRQLANEMAEIIKEILISGNIPIYEKVIKELNSRLPNPGVPMFFPELIKPSSVSDPNAINKIFSDLLKDVIITSEENINLSDKLLSLLNYYEIEKRKTLAELEDQNSRIDAIKKYGVKLISGNILGSRMTTFNEIDFDGDPDNNIPSTTCLVDLRQQKAYNWRKQNRVNLTDSTTVVKTTSSDSITEIYPFDNCLYDIISEAWISKVTSNNTTAIVKVTITLNTAITANSLLLSLLSTRNTTVSLSLSEDGNTFNTKADSYISGKTIEWNFDTQTIKAIQLTITKDDPDGLDGTTYDFYFGLENIAAYTNTYTDSCNLVTKPLNINNANRLWLVTKQLVYPNSNIRYYVIFQNTNKTIWRAIEPATIIDDNTALIMPEEHFTGTVRLVAVFHNYEHSPQLLTYKLIIGGD